MQKEKKIKGSLIYFHFRRCFKNYASLFVWRNSVVQKALLCWEMVGNYLSRCVNYKLFALDAKILHGINIP